MTDRRGYVSRAETRQSGWPAGRSRSNFAHGHPSPPSDIENGGFQLILPAGRTTTSYTA